MRKILIILSCLLLLVSVEVVGLSCGNNGSKQVTTWRLSTSTMPGTIQTNMLQEFADKVSDKTDGTLVIKIFAGGTLYQLGEIFNALSSGAIDLGFTGGSYYMDKAPATATITMYTGTVATSLNQQIALNTAVTKQDSAIIKESNDNGITHLFWGANGSTDSFFKFPVNSPADVKGKKLGCAQGIAPIVQIMGATPVPMDIADAYLSAQTGLIDGWMMCPLDYYVSMKFNEVFPYLVNFQFPSIISVMMNNDSYNALTEEQQKAVTNAASETQADWASEVLATDQSNLQKMQSTSGVHVTILSGDARAAWFNTVIIPILTGMVNNYLTADQITEMKSIIQIVQSTAS